MSISGNIINRVDPQTRNEIYYHLWENYGKPSDNARWGELAFNGQGGLESTEEQRRTAIKCTSLFHRTMYYHLWEVRMRPSGNPNFGQDAFHNQNGLQSTNQERDIALKRSLIDLGGDLADDCAFCLEPLADYTRSINMCGHIFHDHCVINHPPDTNSCALCRKHVYRISGN